MGNNLKLLPGTSKITFQPNPFVLLLCGLIYMWISNPSFLALLASKLGYLWRINSFCFLGPQSIIYINKIRVLSVHCSEFGNISYFHVLTIIESKSGEKKISVCLSVCLSVTLLCHAFTLKPQNRFSRYFVYTLCIPMTRFKAY